MAVQKSRKSRSRRDMRRRANSNKMPKVILSEDPMTGETHMRHHVTDQGFYRGKQIITSKEDNE